MLKEVRQERDTNNVIYIFASLTKVKYFCFKSIKFKCITLYFFFSGVCGKPNAKTVKMSPSMYNFKSITVVPSSKVNFQVELYVSSNRFFFYVFLHI